MKELRPQDRLIENVKRVHMIGIGGSGMCPIAELLLSRGYKITGSDRSENDNVKYLRGLGVTVYTEHTSDNIKGADLVAYSAAVPESNPEMVAAEVLERPADAAKWHARAEALRKAIRDRLRLPDGTFAYFMRKDGTLEPRCEALGAAYCILADVVTGEDAVKALATETLQFSDAGVSLFYPFIEENPGIYHNRAAWPYASTFYYMACEKATGQSRMEQDATQLSNAILVPKKLNTNAVGTLADYETGSFMEYIAWEQQEPRGTSAKCFSISAFMNLCIRNGWLDADIRQSRFW